MGMFDYIECEYKLPLPEFTEEEAKDLKDIKWEETEFQTKDFHSTMVKYTISEDGQLYENKVSRSWEEDKESPWGHKLNEIDEGIEKLEHTGKITFYGMVYGQKLDHWFEFSALYWKGDLKEMLLSEHKGEDNTARLEAQEQFEDALKQFDARKKSWWFPAYELYRKILSGVMSSIRWCTQMAMKLTWKIERWLP